MIKTEDKTTQLPTLNLDSIPEVIPARRTVTLLTMQGQFIAKKVILFCTACPDVLTWQDRTFTRTSAHDYFYTEAVSHAILH